MKLGLERDWEGVAVLEKPPVCLSELPAGLIEATTLEAGVDSITLAHKWYLLISDAHTNSCAPAQSPGCFISGTCYRF